MPDVTIKYDPKDKIWKASTGDWFDTEAKAKAYVKATKGNPMVTKEQANLPGTTKTVQKGGLTISGNPGEIPLKDVLAAVSEFVDYEAEVVEAAADEIDDPSIKAAAKDQAEEMKDAAEALGEAAESANETAAEVFVETNTPAEESEVEVVTGNPLFSRKDYEQSAKIIKSARDKGLDNAHVEQLVEEAVKDYQADNPRFDADRFRKAVYGNPIGGTDTLPGTSAVVPDRPNPIDTNPANPGGSAGAPAGSTPAAPMPVENVDAPLNDVPPANTHWYKKSWSKANK